MIQLKRLIYYNHMIGSKISCKKSILSRYIHKASIYIQYNYLSNMIPARILVIDAGQQTSLTGC